MIYIINPKNSPDTNKTIIAEPIDTLEIFSIVKQKYEAIFLDLDIGMSLPKFNKEDILVFTYDYILPLHTENAILEIKEIINEYKNNISILISKQCYQNYKQLLEIGFTYLIYSNPEYTINNLITSIIKNDFKNLTNVFYIKDNEIIKTPLNKTKIEYIIPERNFDLSPYNDVRTMITSTGCNNK